jgi:uncharacterized protein GlcG (DUF336 family)
VLCLVSAFVAQLARQAASQGPDGIEAACGGAFTIVGGGVVLPYPGELVGAVGVSGGTVEQDRECAREGLQSLAGGSHE